MNITDNSFQTIQRIQKLNSELKYHYDILNSKYGKNSKNSILKIEQIKEQLLKNCAEFGTLN